MNLCDCGHDIQIHGDGTTCDGHACFACECPGFQAPAVSAAAGKEGVDDQSQGGGDIAPASIVGIRVHCAECGRVKKPHGRSGPLGLDYCDESCAGYHAEPRPGCLWPGETDADFGFSCCANSAIPVSELPEYTQYPGEWQRAARGLVGGEW